jgi:hypothetical protein
MHGLSKLWLVVMLAACGDDTSRHIIDAPARDVTGATAMLSHATLFRTDATGTNLASSGGHVNQGAWTTTDGAQNIPGNYMAHVFVSKVADPAATDLLPLPVTLAAGSNTLYFFADSDDLAGGTFGFGINAWIGAATSPSISAFGVPGSAFAADASAGCTAGFDGTCVTAAGSMAFESVTLTAVTVDMVGGGAAGGACTDKVGSDPHNPALLDMPNGTCDTIGSLTFVVN